MTTLPTWPGTAILKTQHNAFNWRGAPSEIFAKHPLEFKTGNNCEKAVVGRAVTEPRLSPAQVAAKALQRSRHGGQYSKAVRSK